MPLTSTTQRTFLMGFIGAISLTGLVGIYVLLFGSFGRLEGRVLATTSTVGAAAILSLASAVCWEARRWHPLGLVALAATAVALLFVIALIWDFPGTNGSEFEKATATACLLAVALAHVALLALARLPRAHEWVRLATVAVVAVLTLLLIGLIWGERFGDEWLRVIGTLAILNVCGTLATPILHHVAATRRKDETVTTSLSLSLTCPRCGRTQDLPAGRSHRAQCGLRFVIEIEEEHCAKCGYVLYRLESDVCPECGTPVNKPPPALEMR